MTPRIKENTGERTEKPTSPKEIVPENHTEAWALRVRRDALRSAKEASSHGRRAGLPSART